MKLNITEQITAYSQMVQQRIDEGFEPYMLAIMFNQLQGNEETMLEQMRRRIELLYSQLLTRIIHHPDRLPLRFLPLWIAAPDRPVPKHHKKSLEEISTNDGLHAHAIVLIPAENRLTERFDLFLLRHHDKYAGTGHVLARLHVGRVFETPEKVTGYCLKSLTRGTSSTDEVLILPKLHSEISKRG